jgi:CcmD family protein
MNALPLVAPALPLHTAGKYVAAAYVVFFALILIYVAIMATRLNRMDRELGELLRRLPARTRAPRVSDSELGSGGDLEEESARA